MTDTRGRKQSSKVSSIPSSSSSNSLSSPNLSNSSAREVPTLNEKHLLPTSTTTRSVRPEQRSPALQALLARTALASQTLSTCRASGQISRMLRHERNIAAQSIGQMCLRMTGIWLVWNTPIHSRQAIVAGRTAISLIVCDLVSQSAIAFYIDSPRISHGSDLYRVRYGQLSSALRIAVRLVTDISLRYQIILS